MIWFDEKKGRGVKPGAGVEEAGRGGLLGSIKGRRKLLARGYDGGRGRKPSELLDFVRKRSEISRGGEVWLV